MLSVGVIANLSLGCNLFFSGPSSVPYASLVVEFILLFVLCPVGRPGLPFFNLVIPFIDGAVSWFTLPSPLLPWLILLPLPMPRHLILPIFVVCISNCLFHQYALSYQVVWCPLFSPASLSSEMQDYPDDSVNSKCSSFSIFGNSSVKKSSALTAAHNSICPSFVHHRAWALWILMSFPPPTTK